MLLNYVSGYGLSWSVFHGYLKNVFCCCSVLVTQSCLTLMWSHGCNSLDSSVHGSLQARILQASSGQPFPSPGDLPNPGIESGSPAFQADSLPPEGLGKLLLCWVLYKCESDPVGWWYCSDIRCFYQFSRYISYWE